MINLYDLQGNLLNMDGYKGLKLTIPSPSYDVVSEKIDGRSGEIVIDKTLQPRQLTADFYMKAKDYTDSLLLRDVIHRQIGSGEFYIAESKLPYKRWRVQFSDGYDMDRLSHQMQTFSVPLTVMSGLAESVGTTQDELTFNSDVWGFGQGLIFEEPKYDHSTVTFRIFNAGDVMVDPREMPLDIIYRGQSNGLEIKNNTTDDMWKYNGNTSDTENIFLRGVQSFKNSTSIFKDTNKKLITLAPGWNDFTLSGTLGVFLISFNHRFYYF
ncbi:phage tail protein [Sporosarcina sp. P21c]|uniref:phage tail domain-containing protein n=1 Tax=Sporosarcina sp. P21c TaxID=2048255 RepID=UPI000C1705F6|nr:phage tail domain-containing protein [Sporosarcina sp. P21c]PIC88433.1 phage tail protein [Sporosarcina sp. P21c]